MTTTELARRAAEEHGWSYALAEEVVAGTFETLRKALVEGNFVKVRKIGTFDFIKMGGHEMSNLLSDDGEKKTMFWEEQPYLKFFPVDDIKLEIRQLDVSVCDQRKKKTASKKDEAEE